LRQPHGFAIVTFLGRPLQKDSDVGALILEGIVLSRKRQITHLVEPPSGSHSGVGRDNSFAAGGKKGSKRKTLSRSPRKSTR
jgi:hypothetical protein